MQKEEVLQQIEALAKEKHLTKDELLDAYHSGESPHVDTTLTKHLTTAETLYYIGGFIVFLGICLLVSQNWGEFSAITKILVTLGSSIVAYIIGLILTKEQKNERVGIAFHLIAALTMPVGLVILFNETGLKLTNPSNVTLITAVLTVWYLLSFLVFRKALFLVFLIIFTDSLYYAATNQLFENYIATSTTFAEYRSLVVALSLIFLGQFLSNTRYRPLTGTLRALGILSFLSTALVLGGWSPNQNIFWEIIFPGLALGTIYLSVYLQSKSFLIFGSLFLMAYILKITGEYFAQSLGWPTAVIFAGLVLIGIGYASFYVNNRYFAQKGV